VLDDTAKRTAARIAVAEVQICSPAPGHGQFFERIE
jgi:hypothetical protein